MHLPASGRFCAEKQVPIPHQVLLADRADIQFIINAVAQIKENVGELRKG